MNYSPVFFVDFIRHIPGARTCACGVGYREESESEEEMKKCTIITAIFICIIISGTILLATRIIDNRSGRTIALQEVHEIRGVNVSKIEKIWGIYFYGASIQSTKVYFVNHEPIVLKGDWDLKIGWAYNITYKLNSDGSFDVIEMTP